MNYTAKTVVLWYMTTDDGVIRAEVFGTERIAAKIAAAMRYTKTANIFGVQRSDESTVLTGMWQALRQETAKLEAEMEKFTTDEQEVVGLRTVLLPFTGLGIDTPVYIREDLPQWAGR